MPIAGRIAARLRSVFDRARLSAEMDDEMREHIDRATDRFLARGLSPSDARAAARRPDGVMSYEMAIQLYGNAAAAAIGREVLVNETPLCILGTGASGVTGGSGQHIEDRIIST